MTLLLFLAENDACDESSRDLTTNDAKNATLITLRSVVVSWSLNQPVTNIENDLEPQNAVVVVAIEVGLVGVIDRVSSNVRRHQGIVTAACMRT